MCNIWIRIQHKSITLMVGVSLLCVWMCGCVHLLQSQLFGKRTLHIILRGMSQGPSADLKHEHTCLVDACLVFTGVCMYTVYV